MLSRRQMLAASPFVIGGSWGGRSSFAADARLGPPVTLNGYFPFKVPKTLTEWESRRTRLREQQLVANGLWPMPARTPLNPTVHGKIDRDRYSIEKVSFASTPGHYVTGNLYRPTDRRAPAPGVLFAHGHWRGGRFELATDKEVEANVASKGERTRDSARYFMQAIPVTLARMGCVVFQYDMVGYVDSTAIKHSEGFTDAAAELRLQSFMGLQTWNSVRALDFLAGLPGVDPKRLGMTGASGGGTQTFVLGAIDDRLTAIFPAVMVSAAMQGGCVCENCSLLRVGTGNVELAALFAPKPLAMSCANDWTKDFLKDGYGLPELKKLYALYGKPEHVTAKAWLEYGHNYNQKAREFMYEWFGTHLLGKPGRVTEPDFTPTPVKELSVYDAEHPRPANELPAAKLRETMAAASDAQLKAMSADERAAVVKAALRAMVCDELPADAAVRKGPAKSKVDGIDVHRAVLGRADEKDEVPFVGVFGPKFDGSKVAVWAHPKGTASLFDGDKLTPAARALIDAGLAIVAMDAFGTGDLALAKPYPVDAKYAGYTFGYNRTPFANRVHDVLTGIAFARGVLKAKEVRLIGFGELGPAAVVARVLAGDAVGNTVVDRNDFEFSQVTATTDPMMLPGAVKYGGQAGFLTAVRGGGPVVAHNGGGKPKLSDEKAADALLSGGR